MPQSSILFRFLQVPAWAQWKTALQGCQSACGLGPFAPRGHGYHSLPPEPARIILEAPGKGPNSVCLSPISPTPESWQDCSCIRAHKSVPFSHLQSFPSLEPTQITLFLSLGTKVLRVFSWDRELGLQSLLGRVPMEGELFCTAGLNVSCSPLLQRRREHVIFSRVRP